MFARLTAAVLACAAALVAGCGGGGDDADPTASAPLTPTVTQPALAREPSRPGELLVRGDSSPRTHGPLELDGSYLVRFVQYAPEDPELDFGGEAAFTAALQRRAGDPRGQRALFATAAASGRRVMTIRGRLFVDVSFGDFPYVIRFTPR